MQGLTIVQAAANRFITWASTRAQITKPNALTKFRAFSGVNRNNLPDMEQSEFPLA
jgi:hypothetical protein